VQPSQGTKSVIDFAMIWSGEKTFSTDIIATMSNAETQAALHQTVTALLRGKTPGSQIIIGIAGGSGSGKSTVAKKIKAGLPGRAVEIFALDHFFKPEEEMPRYWSDYHQCARPHYNHPDSLKVDEMLAFCEQITGFEVVLLDGHFCLYYPAMRRLMDVKCFVDVALDEMLERRTVRNLAEGYGGSAEDIWHYNRECVGPEYIKYLMPTRQYADIVIPNQDGRAAERDALLRGLCDAILERK
jgi:uridine kinase